MRFLLESAELDYNAKQMLNRVVRSPTYDTTANRLIIRRPADSLAYDARRMQDGSHSENP